MRLSIIDKSDELDPELREFAERRLLFAFSRFAPRIDRVSLDISDSNGPRGGVDKVCRVRVEMKRMRDVQVVDEAAEVAAAIVQAVDRARRAVSRTIDREAHGNRPTSRIE